MNINTMRMWYKELPDYKMSVNWNEKYYVIIGIIFTRKFKCFFDDSIEEERHERRKINPL